MLLSTLEPWREGNAFPVVYIVLPFEFHRFEKNFSKERRNTCSLLYPSFSEPALKLTVDLYYLAISETCNRSLKKSGWENGQNRVIFRTLYVSLPAHGGRELSKLMTLSPGDFHRGMIFSFGWQSTATSGVDDNYKMSQFQLFFM